MPRAPRTHRPPGVPEARERRRLFDRERGQRADRKLYTYRWAQASKRFLARHPLCVICLALGRTSAAKVTDHIVPHRGDEGLFWDRTNWQPLCKPCHDEKSGKEAHEPVKR